MNHIWIYRRQERLLADYQFGEETGIENDYILGREHEVVGSLLELLRENNITFGHLYLSTLLMPLHKKNPVKKEILNNLRRKLRKSLENLTIELL